MRLPKTAALGALGLAGFAGLVVLARSENEFAVAIRSAAGFNETRRQSPAPSSFTARILVAGIPGEGNPAPDLTDTILVAQLTHTPPAAPTLQLVSIPRDLAVAGSDGALQRVNSIYAEAKARHQPTATVATLKEIVERVIRLPIPNAALVDLTAFREVVSVLGGVNVEVPETIADHLFPTAGGGTETFAIEAGWRYLDAATAEKYIRTRHGGRGDFDRVRRQQYVLEAIHKKILGLNPLADLHTILELTTILRRRVLTDLAIDDVRRLLEESRGLVSANVRVLDLASDPAGLVEGDRLGEAQVVRPRAGWTDYTEIQKRVGDFFQIP
ncbi:LCP family protein [Candidatus Parcubacteria bacterium]|nr:LCP family protein [Candidatus Parcubacteria bacterium]